MRASRTLLVQRVVHVNRDGAIQGKENAGRVEMFDATFEAEKSLPAVMPQQREAGSVDGKLVSGRTPSRLDELLVAEIFFVQATIESASALGDGLKEARRVSTEGKPGQLGDVIRATGRQVVEPYRERLSFFRRLRG